MRDGLGDWYMPSANTTHAFKSRILYGHFKEAYVHRQVHSRLAHKPIKGLIGLRKVAMKGLLHQKMMKMMPILT
ncbi:hypothetical protein T4E_1771 [Trichinella pseudospiralis]|uniref:Uncharacterized protein n=1 Tax=Trichinella pseudospiralis TaxID=6337 RepID=A0A0V0XH62_TRIPS|nr:hypothetical protein T4E_1771 [Trichinella pseudospiralis]